MPRRSWFPVAGLNASCVAGWVRRLCSPGHYGRLLRNEKPAVTSYQAGDLAGLATLGTGRCAPNL